MKIKQIKTLAGPNIHTHNPALVATTDLEELTDRESREFPDFNENLLELMPSLHEHTCGLGYAGGFAERLKDGTYFGHIAEHIAIELSHLADCGIGVNHGKTRLAGKEPNIYNIIVEYKSENGMKFLLETAVMIVESLVEGKPVEMIAAYQEIQLAEARKIVAECELGPSTRAIIEAAKERNIPVERVGCESLVRLGWGKNRRFVQAAMTDKTSAIAVDIAGDKELTKNLLEKAGIAVPYGMLVQTEEDAVKAWREIGSPAVVKPLDGRQGKGVSVNLLDEKEIRAAFRTAQEYSRNVLVEEQFEGINYRVLIVDGKMMAASERLAPTVTGDGKSTIAALIERENQNPLRGDCHEKPLTKIKVDDITLAHLAKHGHSLEFVPAEGEEITLREGCNLSTGGTARDVTGEVHESVRRMCERAARIVGLDICGVDLVLQDITEPLTKQTGGVIELNAAPGLRMHTHPSEGEAKNVGAAIVEMLYPHRTDGRIPLVSVTGTNGKTTVTRMIAHAFSTAGNVVGMTTTDGIWIDGECITRGDTTGPKSARAVLSDPNVEVAVLETARGGIMRGGLAYDWSDVAVITNIQPDHFGQDGIESVEDILHVKSLIAERVREGGTLVLNADDELLARLENEPRIKKVPKNIVYFSLKPNHITVKRHILAGGTAYTVRNGWLVEATRFHETPIIEVNDVPVALGGFAEFNVANALAMTAACRTQGLTIEEVAAALRSFQAEEHNHGRANLFEVDGAYVFLDYGHNPEAFKSICRMAANWNDGSRRVSGIIAVPGDRANSLIMQAGRIAARGFHRLVIKEDSDLRERAAGEVAQILYQAVREEAPDADCHIILDESEALRREITRLQPGDILVCFYEKFDLVRSILERCDAQPTTRIAEPPPQAFYAFRHA
jgi:cyanophycin synthetase